MPTAAFVDINRAGEFEIKTPYDGDFINELKIKIPSEYRAWNPAERTWRVSRAKWEEAKKILLRHYGLELIDFSSAVEAVETEMIEEAVDDPDLNAYFALGVRSDAPDDVIHLALYFIEWAHTGIGVIARQNATEIGTNVPITSLTAARDAHDRICKHRDIKRQDWLRAFGSSFAGFIAARAFQRNPPEAINADAGAYVTEEIPF